jgi:hypothetical protein
MGVSIAHFLRGPFTDHVDVAKRQAYQARAGGEE